MLLDTEIIKAGKCCAAIDDKCPECPLTDRNRESCVGILMSNAFDLINRQQAKIARLEQNLKEAHIDIEEHLVEIEKLINELEYLNGQYLIQDMSLQSAKSEAREEFADRLKDMHEHNTTSVVKPSVGCKPTRSTTTLFFSK